MKKSRLYLPLAMLFLVGWLTGCNASDSKSGAVSGTGTETVWLTDYDAALKQAQATNKLVVVDFFATWCGPCKMMERDTFADEKVQRQLTNFVTLKIDVDLQPQLAAKYGIQGMPTTLVIDATGKSITGAVGYLKPDAYLAVLAKAKTSSTGTNEVVR